MNTTKVHPNGWPMDEVKCARCIYFHPEETHTAVYLGDCWRFPQKTKRPHDEWCGEFDRAGEG